MKVTHTGSVKISANLILTNVLCVPSFGFNLMSISKLTQNPHYCAFFLSDVCYIQDLSSWRTIELAEQKGGLYHLLPNPESSDVVSSSISCSSISSHNLLHYRLGHMSTPMFKVLQSNNSAISFSDSLPCEIYPLANQKKLPFPSQQYKTQHLFELIHCDICGPMSTSITNNARYFLTIFNDFS